MKRVKLELIPDRDICAYDRKYSFHPYGLARDMGYVREEGRETNETRNCRNERSGKEEYG